MMDCHDARAELLESFDDGQSVEERLELHAHLAGCPECARFAAGQEALDARLGAMFTPQELSAGFRPALRRRIRQDSVRMWPAVLPEIVHFASCGAATAFCAVLLPFDALMVLGVGAAATSSSYVLLAAVRDWFDEAEGVTL